jgi:hypothetical protein
MDVYLTLGVVEWLGEAREQLQYQLVVGDRAPGGRCRNELEIPLTANLSLFR